MGKHAFLIMAHHRPDLLKRLVDALDDERNDLFIHIDAKSNIELFPQATKKSRVVFTKRVKVSWGGYSQIQCMLTLLSEAFKEGPYDYYHILSGVSFPLMTNESLHEFCDHHKGKEFIGFDNKNDFSFRAKNVFLFNEAGKPQTIKQKFLQKAQSVFLILQKKVGYNRLNAYPELAHYRIKKGMAHASITNDFVRFVLDNEELIWKLFHQSACCDECFLQTLAFNSEFRQNIYSEDDEWIGCMREMAWDDYMGKTRPGHNFILEDQDFLLQSDKMFALKFEGPDGLALIEKIAERNGQNAPGANKE